MTKETALAPFNLALPVEFPVSLKLSHCHVSQCCNTAAIKLQ